MAESSIEWTDAVWNPVTGCEKVSPGCAHCYAETLATRFWGDRPFSEVRCHEDRLDQPLRWRKSRRVFVNSMSDLFHPAVTDAFIAKVFNAMADCPHHTFQILTKRPARMRELLNGPKRHDQWTPKMWHREVLPNVHLGVSAENQRFLDERLPLLLDTPAAQRFLSCEPLLEGLDICKHRPGFNRLWVIVGGESGPGARPCDVRWIRSIVRQCQQSDVPVFVKQLGAVPMDDEGAWRDRMGDGSPEAFHANLLSATNHKRVPSGFVPLKFEDRKGGDMAEWPDDLRVRQFPEARVGA